MMVLQTIPLDRLGTAPRFVIPKFYAHFYAHRALLAPIYPNFLFS